MFCPKCGNQIPDNSTFCGSCGANIAATTQPQQVYQPQPVYQQQPAMAASVTVLLPPPKSREAAGILCFFLGYLGVHDFYLGKIAFGLIKLILFFTGIGTVIIGIWQLIDIFIIAFGNPTDNWERPLEGGCPVTKVLVFFSVFLTIGIIALVTVLLMSLFK